MTRRWQTQAMPDLLGTQLVHCQRRSQHTAAGIGNTGTLQQPLDGAIFTAPAMQNDKRTIKSLSCQLLQNICTDIQAMGIHTGVLQCPEYRSTGLQRDRKSTRLNSSHVRISYAVFCLKKKSTPH